VVGRVDDPAEQAADTMADLVVRTLESESPLLAANTGVGRIRRSSGRPLAPDVRGEMEAAFGTDLTGVHIHTGAAADQLSRDLGARAFTTGQDVFFGAGEYRPHEHAGRRVLAHELTHTIQQRGHGACTGSGACATRCRRRRS
jgi:hypothetical protein